MHFLELKLCRHALELKLCVHFWEFCARDFGCTRPDSTASDLKGPSDVSYAYTAANEVCDAWNITSVSMRDVLLPAMRNGGLPVPEALRIGDYGMHPSAYGSAALAHALYDAALTQPLTVPFQPRAAPPGEVRFCV